MSCHEVGRLNVNIFRLDARCTKNMVMPGPGRSTDDHDYKESGPRRKSCRSISDHIVNIDYEICDVPIAALQRLSAVPMPRPLAGSRRLRNGTASCGVLRETECTKRVVDIVTLDKY
jgi:hypothetical protein